MGKVSRGFFVKTIQRGGERERVPEILWRKFMADDERERERRRGFSVFLRVFERGVEDAGSNNRCGFFGAGL